MPEFLSDPAPAVYLILLAFALGTGAMAARYQDRPSLIRFGIALAILLLLYGVDKFNESPREEAVRRASAMARAADGKNADAFVEHVAETIEYRGSANDPVRYTKAQLRTSPFWDMLRHNDIHVAVWDFSRDDVKEVDANTIEVGFNAKGNQVPLYMKATFRKQPDGSWKLAGFASYRFDNHDEFFPIPNLAR